MRAILEELEPRGMDIQVLSEEEGYIVWTDFVDPKMETLKGGTIHSYLGSYELFLTFVTAERVCQGQVPELSVDTLRIFRNTLFWLKGWRKTVDTQKRTQHTDDISSECHTIDKPRRPGLPEIRSCPSHQKSVREGSQWGTLNNW